MNSEKTIEYRVLRLTLRVEKLLSLFDIDDVKEIIAELFKNYNFRIIEFNLDEGYVVLDLYL